MQSDELLREPDFDDEVVPVLKRFWVDKYKSESQRCWTKFYKRNGDRFFRDKHFTEHEYCEYFSNPGLKLLEVGCGPGNLLFPLLKQHPSLQAYACDFSNSAIDLLKARAAEEEVENRITSFLCDITNNDLSQYLSDPVDTITCIFVLSAIPVEKHQFVLQNLLNALKPNGILLFRDYAYGDTKHRLFAKAKEPSKIDSCTYVRQDGTLSQFFSIEYLRTVMQNVSADCYRFEENDCRVLNRSMTNHLMKKTFLRSFVQGIWVKKSQSPSD